jgi:hypothetical protein
VAAGPRVRFAEAAGEEESVQTRAHAAQWWAQLLQHVTRRRRRPSRQSSARSSRGSSRSRGDGDGDDDAAGGGGGGVLSEEWWLDLLLGASSDGSDDGESTSEEEAAAAEDVAAGDAWGGRSGAERRGEERERRGEERERREERAEEREARGRERVRGKAVAAAAHGGGGGDAGVRWMGVRTWWREEMQTLARITTVLRQVLSHPAGLGCERSKGQFVLMALLESLASACSPVTTLRPPPVGGPGLCVVGRADWRSGAPGGRAGS